ncbi:MAG: efflux RND transporter permease subunit, partial [Planctomycetota bacterium]
MSNFIYRNPRLAILMVALILVAGLSSYMVLPRMEDPILTERVAMINTIYPGANAERVEALVTEPIEELLREVEEIALIRSTSRSGISTITVELADEVTEVDEIWSRVRDKLGDAEPDLPRTALTPHFRRMDMKAFAMIVAVAWEQGDDPNYAILRRHAEQLEDVLLGMSGTEKVRTFGDPDEEFVATVDASKLAVLGLTIGDLADQLAATDSKISAGLVRNAETDVLMEVDGELTSQERIGRTPIKVGAEGQVVRLNDVATIQKGIIEPPSSLAIIRGKPAVALGVLVSNDYRVDHWSRRAVEVLEEYRSELPTGLKLTTVFLQNDYVETRLLGLVGNLLLGAAGVMLVIMVLMGWRSALIVGAALPLSAMMVLTGMNFLGIPIHQMSVTGLIIALGLLIDNAIVMVDETGLALREGKPPARAVAETVSHLFIPLLGSTITTALAFAPIALMSGPAGEFVGSIAISVILAIFSSLLLAMTLVPALTAWGLGTYNPYARWWSQGISSHGIREYYEAALALVLRKPWLGVVIGVTLPIIGFSVASQLPEQFFPPADRDQFQIELELPAQSSLDNTLRTVAAIRERVLEESNVVSVDWFVGESAPTFYYNVIPRRENTASYAQALVQLNRLEGARETIHKLQADLNQRFPQTRVLVRQLEQGPPFDAPVEVRIFGPDLERLRMLGEALRARIAQLPHVVHTRADLSESIPKLAIQVDEEAARLAGLNHTSI